MILFWIMTWFAFSWVQLFIMMLIDDSYEVGEKRYLDAYFEWDFVTFLFLLGPLVIPLTGLIILLEYLGEKDYPKKIWKLYEKFGKWFIASIFNPGKPARYFRFKKHLHKFWVKK